MRFEELERAEPCCFALFCVATFYVSLIMDRFNLSNVLNCRASFSFLLLCLFLFLFLLCFCLSEFALANVIMLFLKQFWFLANARSAMHSAAKSRAAPQHATANFERAPNFENRVKEA
ncbi:hypothetical protein V8C43DRAFT_282692 [Trichoderma afarasin]